TTSAAALATLSPATCSATPSASVCSPASERSTRRYLSVELPGFNTRTRMMPLLSEQRLHRLDDVLSADPRLVEQLRRRAGARHRPPPQLAHARKRPGRPSDPLQPPVAQPALRPVVLRHDEPAAGVLRRLVQRLLVNRLDRISVDESHVDALPC